MMESNQDIRHDLMKSLDGLTDDQLNQVVDEGTWTINQVLEHLYLMERGVTKILSESLTNDTINPTTEKPIHLTPIRKHKVDAPDYLIPSENDMTFEEITQKLANSRHAFTEIALNADESLLVQKSYLHPVFGDLSLRQWIQFVGYHEQRHLEQIEEIKDKLK